MNSDALALLGIDIILEEEEERQLQRKKKLALSAQLMYVLLHQSQDINEENTEVGTTCPRTHQQLTQLTKLSKIFDISNQLQPTFEKVVQLALRRTNSCTNLSQVGPTVGVSEGSFRAVFLQFYEVVLPPLAIVSPFVRFC